LGPLSEKIRLAIAPVSGNAGKVLCFDRDKSPRQKNDVVSDLILGHKNRGAIFAPLFYESSLSRARV
jgi:hypothetical protein